MGNKIEICYDKKTTYVGQIKNQLFHGDGTLYYNETGDLYKGQFKDGLRQGYGELQYYNGDKYNGDFYQDQPHGKGKYISNNGYIYEGNFCIGTLMDKGQLYNFNNELIYEGEFLNSLPHGFGISYNNGLVSYVGKWNQNYYQGHGLLIENNNYNFGIFQEGILIEKINNIPKKFLKYVNKSKTTIFDSNVNVSKASKISNFTQVYPSYVKPSAPPLITENPFNQTTTIPNKIFNSSNLKNENYTKESSSIKSFFNPINVR